MPITFPVEQTSFLSEIKNKFHVISNQDLFGYGSVSNQGCLWMEVKFSDKQTKFSEYLRPHPHPANF